uniref:Uncharacterized protein n=1 Tax=Solanum lycopersicum TaxID=4081 RepID=K4AUU8_SOLLC
MAMVKIKGRSSWTQKREVHRVTWIRSLT